MSSRRAITATALLAAAASIATSQKLWLQSDYSPDVELTLTDARPTASYEILVASNLYSGVIDEGALKILFSLEAERDLSSGDLDTAIAQADETGLPREDADVYVLASLAHVGSASVTEDALGLPYDGPRQTYWLNEEIPIAGGEVYEVYHLTLTLDAPAAGASVAGTFYASSELWAERDPPSDLEVAVTPLED